MANFYSSLRSNHFSVKDVAVIFGIGSEKLRYLVGFAYAVHSNGETVEVNLNEIYREAQEAFPNTTINAA